MTAGTEIKDRPQDHSVKPKGMLIDGKWVEAASGARLANHVVVCLFAGGVRNLSPSGDLTEAAANLFAFLRALDRPEHSAIAVMPIPEEGLGRAINDRLRRAAAPRPISGKT